MIEGGFFKGTHTGEPFTFAPHLLAIPATGIHVANDKECLILSCKDGRIKNAKVISLGVYKQIRGSFAALAR